MEHSPSYAAALTYMRKLFPMLNSLSFVQRYAWFTDDCWNDSGCRYGSLYNGAASSLKPATCFRRKRRAPANQRYRPGRTWAYPAAAPDQSWG